TFNGPSVQALYTSNNGGPGGQDTGRAVHLAEPGNHFTDPTTGIEYFGAKDANNATFSIGQRLMPSYLDALVLHDAYGYVITPPQTFGTFYANLRAADGNVLVREGPTSSDTVTVTTEGGNLVVSVDVGVPVPGTGPAGPLTTVLPLGSVSSI